VNAKISLTPATDTNPVGTNHEITCTIQINAGDGAGFVNAPDGTVCDGNIDSGPGSFVGGDTCAVDGGDGNCILTITSAVSGTTTVSACTSSLVVGGVALLRCTDGTTVETGHANGDPVDKVWVNAKISLTPATDTNPVGTNHEITCTIQINAGDGAGFVNAPDGTVCDGNIDSGPGSFVGGDTCAVDGGDGNCILTITSAVSGTTTVSACTSGLVVGGVALLRCTDGATVETGHANGDPVSKAWILGSIEWEKRLESSTTPHPLQGGATFTVGGASGPFACQGDATNPVTVVDNGLNDADPDAGQLRLNNVCVGTYTVTETVAPAGVVIDDDPDRVVSVYDNTNGVDDDGDTVIDDQEELNAVIGTSPLGPPPGVDDDDPAVPASDESDFHNIPPREGCTPGFWQGGAGSPLWDTFPNDPQWLSVINAGTTNPFQHSTLFESFFADPGSATNGLTMFDLVSTGGGSNPVRKAARDLVAAYLNASAGLDFPFTTAQLIAKWNDAIAPGGYSFTDFHLEVAPANQLGCPLGANVLSIGDGLQTRSFWLG
jgi:hypothetical protein